MIKKILIGIVCTLITLYFIYICFFFFMISNFEMGDELLESDDIVIFDEIKKEFNNSSDTLK